ncbi:hypothetical protein CRE_30391, partial [Caenorhabditis remanei]
RRSGRRAAEEVKKEVEERLKPKKTVIREPEILIGPRMGIKGKGLLEMREANADGWVDKYDFEQVQTAVFLLTLTTDEEKNKRTGDVIDKLAREVKELVVCPFRMDCTFAEVTLVTETWKRTLMTSANAIWIEPMKSVGAKQMPMITTAPERFKTAKELADFLEAVMPSGGIVEMLRKDLEKEPPSKRSRPSHQ